MSNCIRTFTGRLVDPLNLKPDDIDIRDIAHALSNMCRFNGHCRQFYSVAEHSVRVAEMVPDEQILAALLHDRAEAYLPDMTRPVKYRDEMAFYRLLEQGVERTTAVPFGIAAEKTVEIDAADKVMCAIEQRDLCNLAVPDQRWLDHPYAINVGINKPWCAAAAERSSELREPILRSHLRKGPGSLRGFGENRLRGPL
jgi:hypothetical protein